MSTLDGLDEIQMGTTILRVYSILISIVRVMRVWLVAIVFSRLITFIGTNRVPGQGLPKTESSPPFFDQRQFRGKGAPKILFQLEFSFSRNVASCGKNYAR